jgi:hypothetical protein
VSSFYEVGDLKIYDSVLDNILNEPQGNVGQHMRTIGLKIQAGAKAMVGVETGKLKNSIYMQHARRGRYQYVQVGSNVRYAYVHHQGEHPHVIVPKHGRLLRFKVHGRVVYVQRVIHPGSRGKKYLTIPMKRVVSG